jgi:hypothetical protein
MARCAKGMLLLVGIGLSAPGWAAEATAAGGGNLGMTQPAPMERLSGVIAHELQHALELSQATGVLHHDDVTALFKRIGFPDNCQRTCSETAAALEVQARVVDEVGATVRQIAR